MLQQRYGSVFITLHAEVGVMLTTSGFIGSEQDEHDWNAGIKWLVSHGYGLSDPDPVIATDDGTEVFYLTKAA